MPKKGISKSDISSIGKPGLYVVVSSGVNRRCSVKKDYSKISQISQEITCIGVLFCGRPCKETPVQVVSCEFAKFLKHVFCITYLNIGCFSILNKWWRLSLFIDLFVIEFIWKNYEIWNKSYCYLNMKLEAHFFSIHDTFCDCDVCLRYC